ncbi:hypothetical protein EJ357_00725 [Streptomyces cyaneochromogenes]|uniref:Uncharacterized protein n=1 Tax=Streptomyces cyaneochromogenes TaxID=2496836 RepID=A0A3Q9EN98_9ACTN|nr:hypothetical protein [Streptomyces cyaneochromogenes]AZQ32180.1 hypothetical protein EJ357_00725 [Streptomyces cyaneochromogenes]
MPLKVDVPELVHRSDLSKDAVAFVRIGEERHQVRRHSSPCRQEDVRHGKVAPCRLEAGYEPAREAGPNTHRKPDAYAPTRPGRKSGGQPGPQAEAPCESQPAHE